MSVPAVVAPSRLNVTDAFGYWFSGFFDGEGCFYFQNTVRGVKTVGLKIRVVQRIDDRSVLEHIEKQIGCGWIVDNEYKSDKHQTKPWSDFRITKIADLAEVVVPLFDRYPLLTKKAYEFSLWRSAVGLRYQNQGHKCTTEEETACLQAAALVSTIRGRTPSR
jgi:hypothetical protein